MSCSSTESADSEADKAGSSFSQATPNECAICRIEAASVFYLKVGVCTGCRAFFRRSIKQKKQYRCLNGRLCCQNARE